MRQQFYGRPIVSTGFFEVLFRRVDRREIPSLRTQYRSLAEGQRRAGKRAGVLPCDRCGPTPPELFVELRARWGNRGKDCRAAARRSAMARDKPRGTSLPAPGDRTALPPLVLRTQWRRALQGETARAGARRRP